MKRITSTLALLALATLLAAGCGGDDDGETAATGATTAGDSRWRGASVDTMCLSFESGFGDRMEGVCSPHHVV